MKKSIFTLLLALAAWTAGAQVRFETESTDAVHEMAVREGKMVFVDLYASWNSCTRASFPSNTTWTAPRAGR